MTSSTQMNIVPYTPTFGPLRDPGASGDAVVLLDTLFGVYGMNRDTTTSGGSYFGWVWEQPIRAQPQGAPVVLLAFRQEKLPPSEDGGGDGFHEHLVQDGRFSRATAQARALAEVANFKTALLTYEWTTDDVNAKSGRMQHIDLIEKGVRFIDDVRIAHVEIEWPGPNMRPLRHCVATRVQPVTVVDAWLTETA
jgi:hypothetical protein